MLPISQAAAEQLARILTAAHGQPVTYSRTQPAAWSHPLEAIRNGRTADALTDPTQALESQAQTWLVPTAALELDDGQTITPEPGDTITDTAGRRWTVTADQAHPAYKRVGPMDSLTKIWTRDAA